MIRGFLSSDDSSEGIVDISTKNFEGAVWFSRSLRKIHEENEKEGAFLVDLISGTMLKCTANQFGKFRQTVGMNGGGLFSNSNRDGTVCTTMNEVINQAEILGLRIDEDPKLIEAILEDIPSNYHEFTIPKRSGGRRKICAPNDDLKRIQRKILDNYIGSSRCTQFAHGFVPGKSIKTNAEVHLKAKVVVKMDMSTFFDTVTTRMVVGALIKHLPTSDDRILCVGIVSKLCTLNGTTPQGCPTSPKLTNLVCSGMDLAMRGLSRKHHAEYTRYADDIIFSSKTNLHINKLIPIIDQIVQAFGFTVNREKTGVFRSGGRLPVTGIVVNDILNVPRRKRMELRAKMHHILVGRITPEQVRADNMLQKIQGYVAFIAMANPQQGDRFKALFQRVKEHLAQ